MKNLSLKSRKTLQLNNHFSKNPPINELDRPFLQSDVEVIAVDDDDEPCRPAAIIEQRDAVSDDIHKCKLPEPKEPNLDKLKELIIRVSSQHRVNGSSLKPFPAYPLDNFGSPQIQKEGLLSSACFTLAKDELTPFPCLPARYLQRKRKKKDGGDKNLADKETDTSKEENKMPDKLNIASSVSVSPAENHHLMRDRNSNFYSLQTRNHKHSHDGVATADVTKPSSSTSNHIAKSAEISGRSSFNGAQNAPNMSSICSSSSSVQSAFKCSSAQKEIKRTSALKDHQNSNVEESHKVSNTPKDSKCSKTQENDKSNRAKDRVKNPSIRKGPTNSCAQRGIKRSSAQISEDETSSYSMSANLTSEANTHGKYMKLDTKNSDFNTGSLMIRPRQNAPNTRYSDTERLKPDLSNSSISIPERRGPDMLKTCPLCQTEFSKNSTQLDIDSHIAQCLSNSEDDVMW